MTGRRVIVHADDFGLHPAINAGIEKAHRDGLVTSASLMPLGPAFDDALARLSLLPDLDIGLHFTLVGVPGCPPTLSAFLAAYGRGALPQGEIAASLRRQLEAVKGLPISHIDSHQHLHALPGIMRVVCQVAAEYRIPAIRLPIDGPAYAPVTAGRHAQAAALAVMAKLSRHYISAYNLRTSENFSGMAVSGHLTAPTLMHYLTHAPDGLTEIVCHPGADNAALSQSFAWGYDWEGEMAALCSLPCREALAVQNTTLTTWREV